MANDFIAIDRNTTTAVFANDLKSAIEVLRSAQREILKIQGWMVHNFNGSDYSDLETKFGIATGLGDDVFVLIDGTKQVLDGTVSGYAKELIDRVG